MLQLEEVKHLLDKHVQISQENDYANASKVCNALKNLMNLVN